MGYTTEFEGSIAINPPLNADEIGYINKFSNTRRMDCEQGPYYVDRGGYAGQDRDDTGIRNYNSPPAGQPGLWCQWVPTEDGSALKWNGTEKFYYSEEWMTYLIDHFLKPGAIAREQLPFLQANHTLSGVIKAQGEKHSDRWRLVVSDNVVSRLEGLKDKTPRPDGDPMIKAIEHVEALITALVEEGLEDLDVVTNAQGWLDEAA